MDRVSCVALIITVFKFNFSFFLSCISWFVSDKQDVQRPFSPASRLSLKTPDTSFTLEQKKRREKCNCTCGSVVVRFCSIFTLDNKAIFGVFFWHFKKQLFFCGLKLVVSEYVHHGGKWKARVR